MSRKNITERAADYIARNHILIKQTSSDLKISEDKLRYEGGESLTATELLNLCHYLNIRPEEL